MSAIAEADALIAAAAQPPAAAADQSAADSTMATEDAAASANSETRAQAEAAKEEGNKLFAACKFAAARDAYTRAIDLDPTQPAFFSNRAFCQSHMRTMRKIDARHLQSSSTSVVYAAPS